MANKIFREMLKPQTHLNKNGFDLSYLHNFTAKIGELLPISCVETVPGGHYEIKVQDLMRTIPMNNPAFLRASQHFEFFFVPYKQLWHQWDDFYTTRSVPSSAKITSLTPPDCTPVIPMGDAIFSWNQAKHYDSSYYSAGDLDEYIGEGCEKIANLLGYPTSRNVIGNDPSSAGVVSGFNTRKPNAFRPAAYQKICFDYYRQPFYDLPQNFSVYAFNLDDANFSTGALTRNLPSPVTNLRCDRYARLFQMHYRQYKKDLFTGVLPSTQYGAVSVVNLPDLYATFNDAQLSAIADDVQFVRGNTSGTVYAGDVNIPSTSLDGRINVSGTGVSIGNNSSGVPRISSVINPAQFDFNDILTKADDKTPFFDVLSLVKSNAIQKWRETTLRSGFRNSQQYEGHFGVKPIFTEKDKCVFIDSVSSPLQVNTVTNTNAGAAIGDKQIALGDLAANGTSVLAGDKTIKFDAKDFGILMCIYSVLPELTYQDFGIDLMNQKVLRDDFLTPEFENIGLQPITNLCLGVSEATAPPVVLGYVPRYSEYKIGVDKQTYEFSDGSNPSGYVGSFAGWSPSRAWMNTFSVVDFYVSPMLYRDMFIVEPWYDKGQAISPSQRSLYIGDSHTDTFLHQCYFDIKAVLPVSVLGLPNY